MTLSRRAAWSGALGIGLGYLADLAFGDPRRFHPVAGFGQIAAGVEQRIYADRQLTGVAHLALLLGSTGQLARIIERTSARHPAAQVVLTAAATWAVLGGRSLRREARTIERMLLAGDLAGARHRLTHLVGRQTDELSADEVARAVVESVAENTSDAVVAPLFWGAVRGVPGLLGYRAVNTLDAMIGHRSPRYRNFGWAAARLDDAANWLPARGAWLLTAGLAPVVGGRAAEVNAIVLRDARRHPSPNAGVVEAAFAGALGVRLGGRNTYHGEIEDRGVLGDGRPVTPADIARTNRLAAEVSAAAAVVAVLIALLRGRRR